VLVSVAAYHTMLYGALVVGLACTVACVVLVFRAIERIGLRTRVPAARALGRPPSHGRGPALWIVGALASFVTAWWVGKHSNDVVFFRDARDPNGDGDPIAERRVYLGDADHFQSQSGKPACARDPTWIVNESTRTLSVRSISYGHLFLSSLAPQSLAPQLVACVPSLDYIGPDDKPPKQVEVETDTSHASLGETRGWVSWDRFGVELECDGLGGG
jgi:hypothetical protein